MSSGQIFSRVVEWSSSGVVAYDAATRQLTSAASLAELAGIFGGGPILVSVSRRTTFVKAIRVPNAGVNEIDLILQTQMTGMFPVALNELAYSFKLTDDITPDGRLAIVAAMREVDLKALLAEAKEAGFKVERVVPAGFGSVLLAESLGQRNAAVVQRTQEGLAIDAIVDGNLRYSRVAPMPSSAASIDAEIGRTFAAVSLPSAPSIAAGGLEFPDADTISAIPTIEALASMSLDRVGINIETREAVEKQRRAETSKRGRLAVLLGAAAVLMATLVTVEYADSAAVVQSSDAKWMGRITKLRNQLKKDQKTLADTSKVADSVTRAFSPAQRAGDVLTVISNYTPKGLWLTGLTFERGKMLFVRGTATTSAAVSDFLQGLTTEPRLRDVKLVFATNGDIDQTPVVQFSIQGFPVGNLPLVDAKQRGTKK